MSFNAEFSPHSPWIHIDWSKIEAWSNRRSPRHGSDACQDVAERIADGRFGRFSPSELPPVVFQSVRNRIASLERSERVRPRREEGFEVARQWSGCFENAVLLEADVDAAVAELGEADRAFVEVLRSWTGDINELCEVLGVDRGRLRRRREKLRGHFSDLGDERAD